MNPIERLTLEYLENKVRLAAQYAGNLEGLVQFAQTADNRRLLNEAWCEVNRRIGDLEKAKNITTTEAKVSAGQKAALAIFELNAQPLETYNKEMKNEYP